MRRFLRVPLEASDGALWLAFDGGECSHGRAWMGSFDSLNFEGQTLALVMRAGFNVRSKRRRGVVEGRCEDLSGAKVEVGEESLPAKTCYRAREVQPAVHAPPTYDLKCFDLS